MLVTILQHPGTDTGAEKVQDCCNTVKPSVTSDPSSATHRCPSRLTKSSCCGKVFATRCSSTSSSDRETFIYSLSQRDKWNEAGRQSVFVTLVGQMCLCVVLREPLIYWRTLRQGIQLVKVTSLLLALFGVWRQPTRRLAIIHMGAHGTTGS